MHRQPARRVLKTYISINLTIYFQSLFNFKWRFPWLGINTMSQPIRIFLMMALYRVKHVIWTVYQGSGMWQWDISHTAIKTGQNAACIRLWINTKWTTDAKGWWNTVFRKPVCLFYYSDSSHITYTVDKLERRFTNLHSWIHILLSHWQILIPTTLNLPFVCMFCRSTFFFAGEWTHNQHKPLNTTVLPHSFWFY
jgi:hypothetical protein